MGLASEIKKKKKKSYERDFKEFPLLKQAKPREPDAEVTVAAPGRASGSGGLGGGVAGLVPAGVIRKKCTHLSEIKTSEFFTCCSCS